MEATSTAGVQGVVALRHGTHISLAPVDGLLAGNFCLLNNTVPICVPPVHVGHYRGFLVAPEAAKVQPASCSQCSLPTAGLTAGGLWMP